MEEAVDTTFNVKIEKLNNSPRIIIIIIINIIIIIIIIYSLKLFHIS